MRSTAENHCRQSKKYYDNNRETIRLRRKREREVLRKDVLEHYGGKCACCGEEEVKFLALDHVNGGGNAHRKLIGGNTQVYRVVRRTNFPNGYQVLCHNCNLAKGFYGECPHNHPQATADAGSQNEFYYLERT